LNGCAHTRGSVPCWCDSEFKHVIIQLIKQSRTNAIRAVKADLIKLYWNIGEHISQKIEKSEWGDSVVTELTKYIQQTEPEIKDFSDKNIWRMKQFYETYEDFPKPGKHNCGDIARDYWMQIPEHFSFVKLGEFVVMPNHVHGILILDGNNDGAGSVVKKHAVSPQTHPQTK
jgi:hypothetical protein